MRYGKCRCKDSTQCGLVDICMEALPNKAWLALI